jgi:hypothetical protein
MLIVVSLTRALRPYLRKHGCLTTVATMRRPMPAPPAAALEAVAFDTVKCQLHGSSAQP